MMLLYWLLVAVVGAEFVEEENVIVLNDENFDKALLEFPQLFVEFYAPWCGHCKKLAPEYAAAAATLKKERSTARLAKIDVTEYKSVGEKYSIRGFPTLKLFLKDSPAAPVDCKLSERTADKIVKWLKKKTGPPAESLNTVTAAKAFVANNELAVIGFFKDSSSAEARTFSQVAVGNDDYAFSITAQSALFSEYGIPQTKNAVVIFRQFDEHRIELKYPVTVQSLTSFLNKYKNPLVVELTEQTARQTLYGDIKQTMMLFVRKSSPDFNAHLGTFKEAAATYRGRVRVAYIDVDTDNEIMSRMGISASDSPAVILYDRENDQKYKPTTGHQLTANKLRQFIQDALDFKLKPYFMSEPVPEDWDKNPVKVLVGTTFSQVAHDPKKDVFVKFYAPWCGHCKSLAPVWDELGEKYSHRDDLVIAKIDVTANDIEDIEIMGFPTLKFFPKGASRVVDYTGNRTLDDFVSFIENGGKVIDDTAGQKAKSEL